MPGSLGYQSAPSCGLARDDEFWAARRVMAFSDELIRAIVKTGQYSDPVAEKHLADVLIKRRNKIGQAYLTRLNPLVLGSLDASEVLTFENVRSGVASAPSSYAASWSTFDNNTGTARPFGETKGSSEYVTAPPDLPRTPGSFILVEVRALEAPNTSSAKPVQVYFRRMNNGWKLVGLERMGKEGPAVVAKK